MRDTSTVVVYSRIHVIDFLRQRNALVSYILSAQVVNRAYTINHIYVFFLYAVHSIL